MPHEPDPATSGYQTGYSALAPIVLDRAYKEPKVRKMLAVLEADGLLAGPPGGRVAVDVGASSGQFAAGLAPHFGVVLGFDIDRAALTKGATEHPTVGLVAADSLRMPLPDACVDLVVCNHTYEHVPDASRLFAEIRRVLRPGGACYLGAASRLTLIEPHYKLPFLSWLPKPLAHRYMRLMGRGDVYYEKLRTWWGIRALVSGFEWTDYTLRVIADPDRFHARDLIRRGGVVSRLPQWLVALLHPLLPSYILVLRKPPASSP